MAQTDTTVVKIETKKNDTIRIGRILIIKKYDSSKTVVMSRKNDYKKTNSRISTNYLVFDLGFANYSDKTDYANTGNDLVNRPGQPAFSASDFKLKIITDAIEKTTIKILEMHGQVIKEVILSPYQKNISIGAELIAGSYMVEVKQGNNTMKTKLLKY